MRPVAKSVFLCDEVVADPGSGKVSVLNLLNSVRVPADESFPYRLAKLCVFAEFRDGIGPSRICVKIRRADSGEHAILSPERTISFSNPRETVYALVRMTNVRFPVAGVYFVEFFCDDEFVDDQVLTVVSTEDDT